MSNDSEKTTTELRADAETSILRAIEYRARTNADAAELLALAQEIDSLFAVAECLAHTIAGDSQAAADSLTRSLIHSDHARKLRAIATT